MNTEAQRTSLLFKQKRWPELLRLAWPIAVSMLSFSLMTVVDTLFVGRLGRSALAAVGLGGIASFTVVCFGFGYMRAAKILVSQSIGAGQISRTQRLAGAALVSAAMLGALAMVLGYLTGGVMPWLASGAESGAMARDYVQVRSAGAPILLIGVALREVLYGHGNSRAPMRAALLANLVNAPLNAWFIFVLDWGVAGAAVGSVIAQGVETFALAKTQAPNGTSLLRLGDLRLPDFRLLWGMGAPLGVERFLDVGSFSVMVALFARMGDVDLAAHQLAVQVLHFAFLPMLALGEATSVLVGRAVGAGELSRVPQIRKQALGFSVAYTGLCSVAIFASASALVRAFTNDLASQRLAVELMHLVAMFVPVHAIYLVIQGTLRGAGDVRFTAYVTVLAAWVCTPSLAFVLGLLLGFGALGGWLGIGAELCLGTSLLLWRFSSGRWQHSATAAREALLSEHETARKLAPRAVVPS